MLSQILSILKGFALAIVYAMGYRQGSSSKELDNLKQDIDALTLIERNREEIRKKYNNLRSNTPDDWDSVKRLYEAGAVQNASKTIGSKDSGRLKS